MTNAERHRHRWPSPKVVELRDSDHLVSRCRCGDIRTTNDKGRTVLVPLALQETLRRAWVVAPDSEDGKLVRETLRQESFRG